MFQAEERDERNEERRDDDRAEEAAEESATIQRRGPPGSRSRAVNVRTNSSRMTGVSV